MEFAESDFYANLVVYMNSRYIKKLSAGILFSKLGKKEMSLF